MLAGLGAAASVALAQGEAMAPGPRPIVATQAVPYPGTILLAVDATDLDHRVQRVQQTVPVARPGLLTMLYPQWIPGHHSRVGDVTKLAGLQVRAGTQVLAWRRDTLNPMAFHIDVPAGVSQVELSFDHLSAVGRDGGRVEMTRQILGVQWNEVLLYPAGHDASLIRVQPRLKLPPGWQQGTALRGPDGSLPKADAEGWVAYRAMSVETLVDSPVFAGRHLQRIELDPPGTAQPVALTVLADQAEQLKASPAQIDAHRALVQQADKLYGARHWRHYDFLLALSEQFGGIGVEHHESSENGVRGNYFKDWDKAPRSRQLLPHEFAHSWNGKFRRPADLDTPEFHTPMQNSLLWVYEGLTEYWGHVLAARAGLTTAPQARDVLAQTAAWLDQRAGRSWRNLQDTTNEDTIGAQRSKPWREWQRGADYYGEGVLIWLDADTLIREKSAGVKSLDDFARSFFGVPTSRRADGSIKPLTYRFDDVVRALDAVQPHDWATFLRTRLDSHQAGAPLDGLVRSGWKLAWAETESEFARNAEGWGGRPRAADYSYSVGLSVAKDGRLESVVWNGPAFKAGLAPGHTVVAVGMQAFSDERLAAAITANKGGLAPIQLLVRDGDEFRQLALDWRGGLRYPRLERIAETPDLLTPIHSAR
ncbi:MAG: M61 family metallopeptidase [Ideonella sp.]|nr:M61 family metallopeptidase [Ideonella sp.]